MKDVNWKRGINEEKSKNWSGDDEEMSVMLVIYLFMLYMVMYIVLFIFFKLYLLKGNIYEEVWNLISKLSSFYVIF